MPNSTEKRVKKLGGRSAKWKIKQKRWEEKERESEKKRGTSPSPSVDGGLVGLPGENLGGGNLKEEDGEILGP